MPFSNCTPFQFLRKEVDVRSPFNNPAKFWFQKAQENLLLEPLAKRVIVTITQELASSFQESSFSYTGQVSSGTQNRALPLRLTARTFVKCNLEYVREAYEARFHELAISDLANDIKEGYSEFFAEINDLSEPLEATEQEDRLTSLDQRSCPNCGELNW